MKGPQTILNSGYSVCGCRRTWLHCNAVWLENYRYAWFRTSVSCRTQCRRCVLTCYSYEFQSFVICTCNRLAKSVFMRRLASITVDSVTLGVLNLPIVGQRDVLTGSCWRWRRTLSWRTADYSEIMLVPRTFSTPSCPCDCVTWSGPCADDLSPLSRFLFKFGLLVLTFHNNYCIFSSHFF